MLFYLFVSYVQTLLFGRYSKRGRRSSVIQKRHPRLTLYYANLCNLNLLFLLPVYQFCNFLNVSRADYNYNNTIVSILGSFTLCTLFDAIIQTSLVCLSFILVVRLWLLYYDYNFTLAIIDRSWRHTINNNEDSRNNFWIKKRKTYGNGKYMFKLLSLLSIIILVLYLVVVLMQLTIKEKLFVLSDLNGNDDIFESLSIIDIFTQIFVTCLSIVCICGMIYKTNHIWDEFKIRKEMNYLLIIECIFSFFVLILQLFAWLDLSILLTIDEAYDAHLFQTIQHLGCAIYFTIMTFVQVRFLSSC